MKIPSLDKEFLLQHHDPGAVLFIQWFSIEREPLKSSTSRAIYGDIQQFQNVRILTLFSPINNKINLVVNIVKQQKKLSPETRWHEFFGPLFLPVIVTWHDYYYYRYFKNELKSNGLI